MRNGREFPAQLCQCLSGEVQKRDFPLAGLGLRRFNLELAPDLHERTPHVEGPRLLVDITPAEPVQLTDPGTAAQASEEFIERTGAKGWLPFAHDVRAQLARVCGDEETCESERAEAERLWTGMGAHGHIERMARELAELQPES